MFGNVLFKISCTQLIWNKDVIWKMKYGDLKDFHNVSDFAVMLKMHLKTLPGRINTQKTRQTSKNCDLVAW
jgi:hypothetical protein